MMDILIRADAYPEIGAGHVMRCLALAHALKERQVDVTFVGRIDSELMRRRIADDGFNHVPLTMVWPSYEDLIVMAELVEKTVYVPLVVLDGYLFDLAYQQKISALGVKVVVIDDTAHHPTYHADLIINQNIYGKTLRYRNECDGRLLLGSEYAMIRPEFLGRKPSGPPVVPERARKILVSFGAGDPDNVTGLAVNALKETGLDDLEVKVVVGPLNRHIETLRRSLTVTSFKAELLTEVIDIASLLSWAELAVVAGGSTCWELALLGIPALVVIVADNQIALAAGIDRAGMAANCGWFHTLTVAQLADRIKTLINDGPHRRLMAEIGRQLVDGGGAGRVADQLMAAA
ncbi:MAG: UDP-2,4-diacetamido-2,4,6-trideoxy-beta-L-altropyranose hydrolase [Proteobacteria bacterium]|nr:UDP-2,4-diacetamido-2,4,6-trideoxy-beta-L-altropyranose hydrolase [Pseudomonadota bacterium]MBU1687950.1 UDP-2,4-diacetamido-2,4,6-trideoxy-beta-L-altropyranose hydrolase [Pseudomonadota bacterium]